MKYVAVWCEYDICGSFGGNNNEDLYFVNSDWSDEKIDEKVLEKLCEMSGSSEEELEGLYGWKFVTPLTL